MWCGPRDGRRLIVRNGGAELVDEINEKGFSSLKED